MSDQCDPIPFPSSGVTTAMLQHENDQVMQAIGQKRRGDTAFVGHTSSSERSRITVGQGEEWSTMVLLSGGEHAGRADNYVRLYNIAIPVADRGR